MMGRIINANRSVVPACDFPLEVFEKLVKATGDIAGIGGYKIGPALTGRPGYDSVIRVAREHTDKPLIFDPQKWGTDIPDTAPNLLTPVKEAGFDAVIIFPESGPATELSWIRAAQDLGLGVIVGGEMTHPRYLQGDVSNGRDLDYTTAFKLLGMRKQPTGFIRSDAPSEMYEVAARLGVEDFVVPGNKPDQILLYKGQLEFVVKGTPTFWSPGLVAQGGDISEGARAAGRSFHAIVGRGIYRADDMRRAAEEHCSKLEAA